jgi:hypothetical protein
VVVAEQQAAAEGSPFLDPHLRVDGASGLVGFSRRSLLARAREAAIAAPSTQG